MATLSSINTVSTHMRLKKTFLEHMYALELKRWSFILLKIVSAKGEGSHRWVRWELGHNIYISKNSLHPVDYQLGYFFRFSPSWSPISRWSGNPQHGKSPSLLNREIWARNLILFTLFPMEISTAKQKKKCHFNCNSKICLFMFLYFCCCLKSIPSSDKCNSQI